jgi:hypothetical protein
MTPSRIANKLRGECSYHTPIRVVLSTKKLSNTVPRQLINEKLGVDYVENVAKIKVVATYGMLRQDQIVFSTFRTQFTHDFSLASCSGGVCLAKHQVWCMHSKDVASVCSSSTTDISQYRQRFGFSLLC